MIMTVTIISNKFFFILWSPLMSVW